MMYWHGGHMMFWQGFLSWTSLMLFWVLLVAIAYLLATRHKPPRRDHREEIQHTLDQRLARGEIDEYEYRRMHELISQRH